MKKLNRPNYTHIELFDVIVDEISDQTKKQNYANNRDVILAANDQFDQACLTQTLCALPKAAHGNPDAIVAGNLTKKQLRELYEIHVVYSKEEARKIYDNILVKARGKCPYCGGIGQTKTLDHYLPKAYFPTYSVLPVNLVPACWDCNRGMGGSFPLDPEKQIIHPYLDGDHFFQEKWVTAEVIRCDPIAVAFSATPPNHWPQKDQSRAIQHFEDCDLSSRYGDQVWEELSPLIDQRKTTIQNHNAAQFRDHLLIVANNDNLLLNGWKRSLYHALAETEWFCNANFNAPNGHMP